MFAIEFKEKKYESMEEHLCKIIKHAKAALECLEWHEGLSYDSTSKHDSDSEDHDEHHKSRY